MAMTSLPTQSLRGHVVASYGRGNLASNVFMPWGKLERGLLTLSKFEIASVVQVAPSQ